ncbi:RING finger protein 151 isoform X1 [Colius striatus]|uniref:RING finger protein 151 isoform X1 n=1 Tax=Colius striatus TaxID=57412 RepID=UPI002B1DE33A|nr:RING finger protein 151 isoform X1 [Colius striatus]XP_061851592.1 RING finger protein 151 isoform X1 [Colius striatus]
MGYDIERFVGYVNEGLLCSICRDVLEDPLQAPCEHAFCTACIHGWLVHHSNCPEDRQMIDVSLLRPLYRYMRNDLNRLQLHCKNREYGCEMICSLESIDRHERECEYSQIPCSNAGCAVRVERRHLDGHLAVCEYRSRECPNGCGYTILSAADAQHNCVAELRTELELLRSEMICRVEEAKHEMESRLDSQRRHMVQKESILQNEIDELKCLMNQMQFATSFPVLSKVTSSSADTALLQAVAVTLWFSYGYNHGELHCKLNKVRSKPLVIFSFIQFLLHHRIMICKAQSNG